MATFYITTTAQKTAVAPFARSNYQRVVSIGRCNQAGRHKLTDDPERADVILFVGSRCRYHWDVITSDLYNIYRPKCLIYDEQDNPIMRLPGLYATINRRHWNVPIYQPGFYLRVANNTRIDWEPSYETCDFLFSFIGKVQNAPAVRGAIMNIRHDRAKLEDRDSGQSDQDMRFIKFLKRSKFVLCPRGKGASTWRLFETMRAGRIPVVASDSWLPPKGPDWSSFCIRVPENKISSIPALLESKEQHAEAMGERARKSWEQHFSMDSYFDWLGDRCVEIIDEVIHYDDLVNRSIFFETMTQRQLLPYLKERLREVVRKTSFGNVVLRAP